MGPSKYPMSPSKTQQKGQQARHAQQAESPGVNLLVHRNVDLVRVKERNAVMARCDSTHQTHIYTSECTLPA